MRTGVEIKKMSLYGSQLIYITPSVGSVDPEKQMCGEMKINKRKKKNIKKPRKFEAVHHVAFTAELFSFFRSCVDP